MAGVASTKLTGAELFKVSFEKQMDNFYEPLLEKCGLGLNDIEYQDLLELKRSLENINLLLQHPDNFGVFKVSTAGNISALVNANAEVQLGALSVLLARKKLILDRIAELEASESIEIITNVAATDGSVGEMKVTLEEKKTKDINLHVEARETALALQEAKAETNQKLEEWLAQQKEIRENMRAKWAILQTFLEKESVSTIVGGLLLIIITITLIIAVFVHVTPSDILTNSFLVILGYFFGQSVGRASAQQKEVVQ